MRIAVVDDCVKDREQLSLDICRWAKENKNPFLESPVLYGSGEVFLEALKHVTFDVIFLDIYMGGMNGMETARRIRKMNQNCRLVFVSSSMDYAVESYDVESTYYMLKPYSYEKLCIALERCEASVLKQEQTILVPTKYGKEKLYIHDIAYTEYENRHITVYMKNKNSRVIAARQGDFAEIILEYPFFCDCMKGLIVNFEAVEQLQKDRFLLKSGQYIPISRLKYQSVREQYLEYSYTRIREG